MLTLVKLSAISLRVAKLSVTILRVTILSVAIPGVTILTLVMPSAICYAGCNFSVSCCPEFSYLRVAMLTLVMLSGIILRVAMLVVTILRVAMLIVDTLRIVSNLSVYTVENASGNPALVNSKTNLRWS